MGVRSFAAGAQLCVTPVKTPLPCTPSPREEGTRSLPRLLGRVNQQPHVAGMTKEACPSVPEHITGEEASTGIRLGSHLLNESSQCSLPQGLDLLTSSTCSTMGLSVHNTFLHAPMPPPTPVRTDARFRSRSLPRMGSDAQ